MRCNSNPKHYLWFPRKIPTMISVKKALDILNNQVVRLDSESIPLECALNRCLSASVYSPISFPPFNQSAMDGYAICGEVDEYNVNKIVQAGADASSLQLSEGEAVRIFTGAMVPAGADRVVRQEDTSQKDNSLAIQVMPALGANIRPLGEQIEQGELLVESNTFLTPGIIGYLAMVGVQEVKVFKKPKITLIITGDELIQPGQELKPGKVFESNSILLKTVVESDGLMLNVLRVRDNLEATQQAVCDALKNTNILLLSGGISVGDYDFVRKALESNQVEEVFYKIRQKPGKPLYFGRKQDVFVFGLPGNPAAAYTCYAVYCRTLLAKMNVIPELLFETGTLGASTAKKSGLTHFMKAVFKNQRVYPTTHQNSSMLSAFVEANCLAILDEETEELNVGSTVEFLKI